MSSIAVLLAAIVVVVSLAVVRGRNAARSAAPAAEVQAVADHREQGPSFQEIEADRARALIEEERPEDLTVLDVRSRLEVESGHIEGALWIPIDELQYRASEVPAEGRLLVVCAHGIRSAIASDFLSWQRRDEILNLSGGMASYQGRLVAGLPNA